MGKGLNAWQMGLAGIGLATVLGIGIGYVRGRDLNLPPAPSAPVTYTLPSRDAIASTLREPMIKARHVVQKGETYPSIGEKLYGAAEAGKRVQSINEYMGNVSMVQETFVTDAFVDVNGDGKRTYWDFARRPRIVNKVEYPVLAVGDSLFTPRYMTGFDGRSYEYSAHVSQAAIDSAYSAIEKKVTDSLGAGNVKFVMPFEEGQSGRRFDGEIRESGSGHGVNILR